MSNFLQEFGELVYQEAPLLGSLIPVPGPAGEYAIRAVLNAFGIDATKKETIIPIIKADESAPSKLVDVQNTVLKHVETAVTAPRAEETAVNKDDEISSPHADSSSIRTDNSVKVILTVDVSKKG